MKYLSYLFAALLLLGACAKETAPEPTSKVVPPIAPKDSIPLVKTDSLTLADTCKITFDEYPTWFNEIGWAFWSIVVPHCNCPGTEFTFKSIGESALWHQSAAGLPDTFEISYGQNYFTDGTVHSGVYHEIVENADLHPDFKITHVASMAVLIDSVVVEYSNDTGRPDLHKF